MISIEIPNVQLYNSETDKNLLFDDTVAGAISQHLANAVITALKNGAGFSIREKDVEVEITTRRSVQHEVTETYLGR